MRIALIQPAVRWRAPQENIRRVERLIAQAGAADLYLLPEMWATGFHACPYEEMDGHSQLALEWMRRTAAATGSAVAGALAMKEAADEDGAPVWRNRFLFIRPDGTAVHYDKRHLFAPAGEHRHYLAGTRRTTVEWRGVRFLLQTCFDLRFPESARRRAHAPYDVVLYTASWPQQRQRAWNVLLAARAIENQAYAIGVNNAGEGGGLTYLGHSAAYGPDGTPLAPPIAGEGYAVVDISAEAVHRFRLAFPVPLADDE